MIVIKLDEDAEALMVCPQRVLPVSLLLDPTATAARESILFASIIP